MNERNAGRDPTLKRRGTGRELALVGLLAVVASPVQAEQFRLDNGVTIRWDNTVKYSAAARVTPRVDKMLISPSFDDADRNFDQGLISNRVDLFSELDVSYQGFGARVSAAAWYDTVYNQGNDNDSPGTFNGTGANDEFTDATRDLHGRKAEILDAFIFGDTYVGDMNVSGRLGRHSFLYGESLFFGANGVAAAQAPIDAVKALSVPNTQYKELLRPVNQVSGRVQLNSNWSIGGYYQFEWERNRIPAAGSYFNVSDTVDRGGQRAQAGAPGLWLYRGHDQEARDTGQGGLQLRWRPEDVNTDFGLYYSRYHEKNFVFGVQPGLGMNLAAGKAGEYALIFPEDIDVFGASFSTTVGTANVAGEISYRRNMPFSPPGGAVVVSTLNDNDGNPAYPVGTSMHANLSMIDAYPESAAYDAAALVGEIAWNRRLSVTKNRDMLDPNTTRDAVSLRFVFEPSYYQVIDGLDITVPIGVGYSPYGKSSVVQGFGVQHGGDISIGVSGTYLNTWRGSLNFTHYYGPAGSIVDPVTGNLSFKQVMTGRDFVALSLSRTF